MRLILVLMTMPSALQSTEWFHLAFLRALVAKAEDKRVFALKGGCNLRFYFASVRYSEDIDIDVAHLAVETLKNKVDRLLQSPMLIAPLRAQGIEIVDVSTPKQTETTQRWKVGLRVGPLALRTKIEFSRRSSIEGAVTEAVHAGRGLSLPPFLAAHYPATVATAQKIAALAGRTEPQARDVFDLHLLLARPDTEGLRLSPGERAAIPTAIDNAMGIGFDEYRSAVVAYLDHEQADLYADASAWGLMVETVIARLEGLA